MINVVTIQGNLTRDAEKMYTSAGTCLLKFTIANNQYKGKDKDQKVNYVDCQLWGKYAEAMADKLTKGREIIVVGEWDQQRWEKDGEKKSRDLVNVSEVSLTFGGKQDGPKAAPAGRNSTAVDDQFEDDVPF